MVRRVLGDVLPPTHARTMVAPKVRSSYQTDSVARVEAEGLPLAGVVRSAIQLVEFNLRDQCNKNPLSAYHQDGFPLRLKEVSASRRFYKPSSQDFHMDSSVVDPELAGSVARDYRVEPRVVKSLEEVSRFTLATLSTQDHLLATISSLLSSIRQVNGDMDVPAEEKVGVVAQICSSVTQLLDSVGTCVVDLAKSSATTLGQATLIRRESILHRIGGLSSGLSQELRQAPLLWPSEHQVVGDQPHYLFRGRAAGIEEDRRKEAQRMSLESMAQGQRKRPQSRQEFVQPKRSRMENAPRPAQGPARQESYGGRGGYSGRNYRGTSRGKSGSGAPRRGPSFSSSSQPPRVVKKRF